MEPSPNYDLVTQRTPLSETMEVIPPWRLVKHDQGDEEHAPIHDKCIILCVGCIEVCVCVCSSVDGTIMLCFEEHFDILVRACGE